MHHRDAENTELSLLCRAAERPARHKKHPSGSFRPQPPGPEGAKDVSPRRRPGLGRSVPFLPILKPRKGVTQPPMSRPSAMGGLLRPCVAPLRGLILTSMGVPIRGYAPGYDVSPLWGERPARKPSHRCRKDTAFSGSGFSRDPRHASTDFYQWTCQRHSRTGS